MTHHYQQLADRTKSDLAARKARKNKARTTLAMGYVADNQLRGIGGKGSYSFKNLRGQV